MNQYAPISDDLRPIMVRALALMLGRDTIPPATEREREIVARRKHQLSTIHGIDGRWPNDLWDDLKMEGFKAFVAYAQDHPGWDPTEAGTSVIGEMAASAMSEFVPPEDDLPEQPTRSAQEPKIEPDDDVDLGYVVEDTSFIF